LEDTKLGLFDTIKVNRDFVLPLPPDLGELSIDDIFNNEIQTKDLGESMSIFDIHSDGSMTEREYRWVEDEKEKGDKKSDRLLDLGGSMEPTGINISVPAPQSIEFYCYVSKDAYENDYCIEWLYFYDSDPIKRRISLTKFEKWPNAERKANVKRWQDEMRARKVLFSKWYMKPYLVWADVVRWVFRKYRRIKNKLPNDFKVERWLTPL